MWIILDLASLSVAKLGEFETGTFQSKAEAETWAGANRKCRAPFYVHVPDDALNPDVAAARVKVAATLKTLADESGGYDVLQNALDYLRA